LHVKNAQTENSITGENRRRKAMDLNHRGLRHDSQAAEVDTNTQMFRRAWFLNQARLIFGRRKLRHSIALIGSPHFLVWGHALIKHNFLVTDVW
jgi:hypothetical protein